MGDASPDDIASQKSSIEAENEQLEQELEGHNQELAATEELTGKLDDVDTKIEDLTSGARQVRQAPTSCDEIAELVSALELAETATERLTIVARILSTTITKCTTSDKLLKVKIHEGR